ncbi:hypothetical protein FOMG_18417 [Fusarium oxysporum f. sp. melonis 26406]|uniref:F-box domain-containing protein n=1 Tax=Fusarium oxysporum f. sp. melonis 26406 TaxID=1089452 RepID=W9YZB1_FUSOX|nr:hypothetical protein FOMG_18417 [Fusarium oxysporum f. sp. melonis 26406]
MSTLSPPLSLSTLPSEIQNAIISLLDSLDRLILRTTSRHFRTIIPITSDDLLTAEQALFSHGKDIWGCYDCLCLRRAACFADNMRKGKRGRQVPEDSFSENRWVCITCWEPVARRRREKEREQQNIRYQQEKAAKAKARAERRARLRDRGWVESEIEDMVSDSTTSDEDIWSVYSD